MGLMQENHLCETSTKLLWAIKKESYGAKNSVNTSPAKKKKCFVRDKSEASEIK